MTILSSGKSDSAEGSKNGVWKVLLATFIALGTADVLRGRGVLPDKQAALLGLLLGLLAQQVIPPRLSLRKLLLFAGILCAISAVTIWLNW